MCGLMGRIGSGAIGSDRVAVSALAALAALAASVLVLSACSSTGGAAPSTLPTASQSPSPSSSKPASIAPPVPDPPLASIVPAGYRTQQIWRQSLSGGNVPEVIVSSIGASDPTMGWQSADLQVLSWDPIAARWNVAFDAQTTIPQGASYEPGNSDRGPGVWWGDVKPSESGSILDPGASASLGEVRFANLLPGAGTQMIFDSSNSYGGSGIFRNLVVLGFADGLATIEYLWSGASLGEWSVNGDTIDATAAYLTPSDPQCCPAREYDFTIGSLSTGDLWEVHDERPWLGTFVKPFDEMDPDSALRVVSVAEDSPAAGLVEPGDVILSVRNSRPVDKQSLLGPALYDELAMFDAGQTAELVLSREGVQLGVNVPLGSLIDQSVGNAVAPDQSDGVVLL